MVGVRHAIGNAAAMEDADKAVIVHWGTDNVGGGSRLSTDV